MTIRVPVHPLSKSYIFPVVYIAPLIVLAHLLAPEAYSWQRHSISQLAAQGYVLAWIMRAGFIGFGLLMLIIGLSRMRGGNVRVHAPGASIAPGAWRKQLRELPILLYGLAILLSGLFSAEPFVAGAAYSPAEAELHGLFATTAGLALSAAMLLYALSDAPAGRRVIHVIALALTFVLSFAFLVVASPAVTGITQRLLWVVGFAWLLYLGRGAGAAVAPVERA